jgi:hypothetical protein
MCTEDKIKLLARSREGRRVLLRAYIERQEVLERKKRLSTMVWYKRWWYKLIDKA